MQDTVIQALRRGDHAAAAVAARRLAEAEPDNAEAHHLLGLALRGLGEVEAAQASLDRAVALAPDNAVFQVSRALGALREARFDAARAALDEAIRLDPNQLAAYVTLAHLALAGRDLDEAERQLALVRRVNPDHPHALVVQGNVALARGDQDEALRCISRAAQFAPDDPMVLSALGLAYLAKGHFAFAEQALRKGLEKQPEARRLRWALIECLRRQHRPQEALDELRVLNQADPADPAAAMFRSDLALALGQRDEAAAVWRELLRRATDPAGLLGPVLGGLVDAGLPEQAVDAVEELLARDPGRDAVWAARLQLAGDSREAYRAQLERWLQARPDSLAAREHQAHFHEVIGELTRAAELADALLAQAPERDAAQQIKLRAELHEAPAAALARADALLGRAADPQVRRVLMGWRGLALDRLGRYDEAAACWAGMDPLPQQGMQLPPGVADTIQNLPAPAAATSPPPRLLWGAPGSTPERVAALLGSSPDCRLLGDRFGPPQRPDGLWPFRQDDTMVTAAGWRRLLESGGVDPDRAIDWLPHWDARTVAAMPEAHLIACLRDPRDMLLNWCVYGCVHRFAFPTALHAADWLAHALAPLAQWIERAPAQVLVVRGERLDAAPEAVAAELAEALGLAARPDPQAITAVGTGLGGHATAFPAGHWRHYAQALAEPFARLEGVAARLGY